MQVAPHAGAWIETSICSSTVTVLASSHPTRVRGLKQDRMPTPEGRFLRRTPRGCVD